MSFFTIDEFSEAEQERMRKFIIDAVAFKALEAFEGIWIEGNNEVTLTFNDFHIDIQGGEIAHAVIKKNKVRENVWVNKLMNRS